MQCGQGRLVDCKWLHLHDGSNPPLLMQSAGRSSAEHTEGEGHALAF